MEQKMNEIDKNKAKYLNKNSQYDHLVFLICRKVYEIIRCLNILIYEGAKSKIKN